MENEKQRERLVELLKKADESASNKMITDYEDAIRDNADYLIANNVVVLPCKVGTKHNKLTFISVDEEKTKEKGRQYYILRCDCGNIKSVRKDLWESGNTKACGCLYETHGQAKGNHTRLYDIYHGMKKRCYNKNDKSYKYYGGRGIIACEEWNENFESFYDWAISNGYTDELTIERIDVDGNYCPENCTWITMEEQHKNTRKITPVKIVETGEIFSSIAECARHLNGSSGNISNCLNGKLAAYKGFHFEKLTKEEFMVSVETRNGGRTHIARYSWADDNVKFDRKECEGV